MNEIRNENFSPPKGRKWLVSIASENELTEGERAALDELNRAPDSDGKVSDETNEESPDTDINFKEPVEVD